MLGVDLEFADAADAALELVWSYGKLTRFRVSRLRRCRRLLGLSGRPPFEPVFASRSGLR